MPRTALSITTRDGICPASLFTPEGTGGPWPGVVFFMDGLGIRPALWQMAQHLADGGYAVLLADLYYRNGPYAPKVPAEVFAAPDGRAELMKLVGSLDRDRKVSDAGACIDALAARPEVRGHAFGATGYCMGGNIALTAAGAWPDRLAAVASFHGGHLASDKPDSPHLAAAAIRARLYIGGARDDASFPEEQRARLAQALGSAGVDHAIETYPALHGFAVPDHPAHDAAAADRHWDALFKLFKGALGPV